MERLKNMSLSRAFFLLALCGLLAALGLALLLWTGYEAAISQYPLGGVSIGIDGTFTALPQPTPEQLRLIQALYAAALLGFVVFPVTGLGAAGAVFYHWKLKKPLRLILEGTRRIQAHDLDFTLPDVSGDELGKICAAFENMRHELLKTNQELWRQAEERKRLNAAFAHDLRNPITVLKGTVKLLRQDPASPQALDRLEQYTLRIEQYVGAMSSVQRLEQLPINPSGVSCAALGHELEETARLLAPALDLAVSGPDAGTVRIDRGIFMIVAENLIGNGARFAQTKLEITLALEGSMLRLSVADDGPGFPPSLLKNGPKPFERQEEQAEHFGMGLYTSGLLCRKHRGGLRLSNRESGGAVASASLKTNPEP